MEIVPMLPIIEPLIEKCKDPPVCKQRNSLLPLLSNTNYNGYLKEIAAIGLIHRKLHTHLACHSFADIPQKYAKVRKDRI
jgi:hypothetical protein